MANLYGFPITVNYRADWGMYARDAMPFNHKSPQRCETFVTSKITLSAVAAAEGQG